ncbi:hypothetical protein [Pseudooceanicola sp. 200-1SW]|uniref:hypothetical protein n=1 Tax=Pseudooceanicola sp. 200-1SW TaxID=3425949 RepID=UPI003D7FFA17
MADPLNSLDRHMDRSARRLRRKLGGKRGHLHLRDADLDRLTRRAGRDLPAPARREAQRILATRAQMQNPRLAARMDPGRLDASFRRFDAVLGQWNPARRRRNMWLNAVAGYAFNLLLFGALLAGFLHWQG